MARLLGPDPSTRRALVFTSGRQVQGLPGKTLTLYTDEAGDDLADVAEYDGTSTPGDALADSEIKIGQDSMVPRFWFPDGVDTLWGQTRDGHTLKLTADVDARMDTVTRAAATPGLKVPVDWGQFWYPKLAAAKAGTGQAVAAFVGSSTTQGYYASNPRETSAVALVRQALHDYAGAGGSGFEGMQWSDTFFSGAPVATYNAWSALGVPWEQTGTWSTPTFWHGPALGYLSGAAGATVTIPFSGTAVDLWFYNKFNPTIESFTYNIDSGARTGTVTSDAVYGPDLSAQYHRLTGLTAGDHTITLTAGANGTRFVGVRGWNAAGAIVDNFGIAGMQSYGWSNRDSQNSGTYMGGWRLPADLVVVQAPLNDMIKAVQSYAGTGTTDASTTITNALFRLADIGRVVSGTGIPVGAKIVSVSEGVSATLDQAATATATITATLTDPDPVGRWVSNTQTYLDGVRDDRYAGNVKSGAVDIVFTLPIIRSSSDPAYLKARVAEATYGLADYYGAAVVNTAVLSRNSWIRAVQQEYMGTSSDPGADGIDDVHLSDAGFQALADQLLTLLLPQ